MTYLDLDLDEAEFDEFLSTYTEEEEPEATLSSKSHPGFINWDYELIRGPRRDTSWMKYAACRGMSSELFFPERGGDPKLIAYAKKICAGCPVEEECLNYAVENKEEHGVWGGESGRGRRQIISVNQRYFP